MNRLLAAAMLGLLWAGVCLPAGADDKTEEGSAKPAEGSAPTVTENKDTAIEPLIAQQKDFSGDSEVRRDAAESLGKLGDARAVKPLIACLKDAYWEVRRDAVESLGKLGDARAVDPLIACLNDENADVRLAAAKALETLGYKPGTSEARIVLSIARQDWDTAVQEGPAAAEPLVECLKDSSVTEAAVQALAKLGPAAVDPLIACLKHRDALNVLSEACDQAVQVLIKLGPAAVEPLIACLKDEREGARYWAATAFEKIGDARVVQPLIVCLKDEGGLVRHAAATALERLGYKPGTEEEELTFFVANEDWKQLVQKGPAAVTPLLVCMKQGPGIPDYHRAAEVLIKLGAAAVDPLIAALKDPDEDVRKGVAETLGRLGDARAVDPLIACLNDPDQYMREEVVEALGQLGDRRAVEPLIACLTDEVREVRMGAVNVLGRLRDTRAVDPVIARLKDGYERVRRVAAESLGQLGDARAVEPLIACLKDPAEQDYVRHAAAQALACLGVSAAEPLLACLKEQNESVRRNAAEALGQLGDARAVEPLIACLTDPDADVREATALALGRLGDPRAVEPLIARLKDENDRIRPAAATALRQLGDARAVEPLIACLKDDDNYVHHAVMDALGRLGPSAVEPLIACLKNESPRTRQGAALALGRLGDPRAAAPLTACLKDQDEAVRSQVERALKEMELKPFIEKGTHMLDVASADLNGDGTTDYILVLENQWQKPEELRIEEGPRPLLILLRDAVGRLKSVKRNDKMIGSTETLEGADDFGGVEAGVKTFTVHHGGSYGNGQAWSTAYTFNYSRIDKTWQLVKAEEYRGQRSNEEEINEVYTPPKDYGKIDIADFDPATYLWKGER